jgi:DNA-directed RNA polymerase alpha subunit
MGLFGEAIKNGKKSQGLVELRKAYYAKLDSIKAAYDNEIEKTKAMEEEERLRTRRLRIGSESEARVSKKELSEDILNLGLGTRIEKALLEADVTTLDDLKKMAKSEISAIKGLGAKAVEDITKSLGK